MLYKKRLQYALLSAKIDLVHNSRQPSNPCLKYIRGTSRNTQILTLKCHLKAQRNITHLNMSLSPVVILSSKYKLKPFCHRPINVATAMPWSWLAFKRLGFVQEQGVGMATMVTDTYGYDILYRTQVAIFHHIYWTLWTLQFQCNGVQTYTFNKKKTP